MSDLLIVSNCFGKATLKAAEMYHLDEPILLIRRKVLAQHDGQGEHHFPATPKHQYRALYFQTLDNVIMGLTTRFEPTETSKHLSNAEKFMIRECDVSYIMQFYKRT